MHLEYAGHTLHTQPAQCSASACSPILSSVYSPVPNPGPALCWKQLGARGRYRMVRAVTQWKQDMMGKQRTDLGPSLCCCARLESPCSGCSSLCADMWNSSAGLPCRPGHPRELPNRREMIPTAQPLEVPPYNSPLR